MGARTIVDQFGIKISGFTPSFEALGHLLNMCGVSKKPSVEKLWRQYANELELTVSRFRAVSGQTKRSSYVKGNWWVE